MDRKKIHGYLRLVRPGGKWGGIENTYGVYFDSDEDILECVMMAVPQLCQYTEKPLSYTLKMGELKGV